MTVTGATKVLAIFGNPVTHSLSPQMHAGWFADHGIDATYVPLTVHPDHAVDTFRALKRLGLYGANVTVPFKEAALQAADVSTEDAAALGVANTLTRRGDLIEAHNTDWQGARAALDEAAPHWLETSRRVLLIGAGGAARAMGLGLVQDGAPEIVIVNRTHEKAQAVARFLGGYADARAAEWSALAAEIAQADVIVNASTLGMKGQADIAWPLDGAKAHAIVYDAVYAPLETSLLRAARARGLHTVDGLGMLIHQGARAFEIWFGIRPDTAAARTRLLAILASRS
jgi:shikimate dehydrogenase